ncbi:MAG: ASPIC/UnbV domain-containing protein [Planctomycetota bacterium]
MNSFSGGERNRLFLQANENFVDASLVSGIDSGQDGRGFGLFDFDRDGLTDFAIASAQSPSFRIVRNCIGGQATSDDSPRTASITLIGGHNEASGNFKLSPRDPYGAEVRVFSGGFERVYLYSCGEGLSTQNSKWISIGLGSQSQIDKIEVRWPSGKVTQFENLSAGKRLTLFENQDMAPQIESLVSKDP